MSDNLPATSPPQGAVQPIVPSHLSPQVVEQLVANQTRDLELKASDLALQQQKDTNGFTYAMKALEAQVSDRKDDRVQRCRMKDRLFLFAGGMSVLGCALIGYCLHSGHEAIALELIKLVSYVGVGVFGGYGFGKRASKSNTTDESNQSGS